MTLLELYNALVSLGYPVAYSHFVEAQTPPFICYVVTDTNPFSADNKPIHENVNVDIELYVKEKSLTIENQIKNLLTEKELPWIYNELFIDTEGVFQCTFSITLI